LDAVNHLDGNYLVTLAGNTADVFAYAAATHYKTQPPRAKPGNL